MPETFDLDRILDGVAKEPVKEAPKLVTNIKGLPEGHTYFTEVGYSQRYPWVEIKRSASGKTIWLAKIIVARDPEWKPHITPGGFAGHCDNQSEQTWLFGQIAPLQTTSIRQTKLGWSREGVRFIENQAVEFCDYNF